MSVIPKDSTVLVTGANGYIASHVADQLLRAGFKVRGTVRSAAKGKWLQELFEAQYGPGNFEIAIVEDMTRDGVYDQAIKGVAGIVHLASVTVFSDNPDDVVPPTVAGAINILKSATREPSVKSFVYTSSSTAALFPQPNVEIKVDKSTWNEPAMKAVQDKSSKLDGYTVYGASKTYAEKFAAVLPNANFGPGLGPQEPSSTGGWIVKLFRNDNSALDIPPQYYVDVRDDARIQNWQRIFAFAAPYNFNDILAIFRKQNPGRKFLDDIPDLGRDLSKVPNDEAKELLRKHFGQNEWTSLEESIRANTKGV